MLADIQLLKSHQPQPAQENEVCGLEALILMEESTAEALEEREAFFEDALELEHVESELQAYGRLMNIRNVLTTHGLSKAVAYYTFSDQENPIIETLPDTGDPTSEITQKMVEDIDVAMEGFKDTVVKFKNKLVSMMAALKEGIKRALDAEYRVEGLAKDLKGKKFDMAKFKGIKARAFQKANALAFLKRALDAFSAFELCTKELGDYLQDITKTHLLGGKSFSKYLTALGVSHDLQEDGRVNLNPLRFSFDFIPAATTKELGSAGWNPQDFAEVGQISKLAHHLKSDMFAKADFLTRNSELWSLVASALQVNKLGKDTIKGVIRFNVCAKYLLISMQHLVRTIWNVLNAWEAGARAAKRCILK